jgi:hypothetical protein
MRVQLGSVLFGDGREVAATMVGGHGQVCSTTMSV